MPRLPRSLRRHRSRDDRDSAPPRAPGELRARVLASVRGEPSRRGPGDRDGAMRRRLSIAVLVFLAALCTGVVLLAQGSPRRPGGGGRSHVTASASLHMLGDHGELQVSGMSEPPIGEVYEVWLQRAGQTPKPTDALFTVTNAGEADVEIPGSLRGVRVVTVTAEPLGGSATPTSPPVLRLALDAHHG